MDADLVKNCADPELAPSIVEQFVAAVGSMEPLAITIRQDGRLVLIPKPKTLEEAVETIKDYVGQAVVRVGITQLPAGIGLTDVSQLKPDMFEPCANLRDGTSMFAKVARIVTKWYGRPTNIELLPQMMDDALYAWKTGKFEEINVFRSDDPGGPTFFGKGSGQSLLPEPTVIAEHSEAGNTEPDPKKAAEAGIRIDMSRIGGQK